MYNVLVVVNDRRSSAILKDGLERILVKGRETVEKVKVEVVPTYRAACSAISRRWYDAFVIDSKIPEREGEFYKDFGLKLAREIGLADGSDRVFLILREQPYLDNLELLANFRREGIRQIYVQSPEENGKSEKVLDDVVNDVEMLLTAKGHDPDAVIYNVPEALLDSLNVKG